jgi:hypothetical protein
MLRLSAFLTGEGLSTNKLAQEIVVSKQTPPTFLSQAEDDPYFCELGYYLALKERGTPGANEMHIFPKGRHGYGNCAGYFGKIPKEKLQACTWPERAEQWMRTMGYI